MSGKILKGKGGISRGKDRGSRSIQEKGVIAGKTQIKQMNP